MNPRRSKTLGGRGKHGQKKPNTPACAPQSAIRILTHSVSLQKFHESMSEELPSTPRTCHPASHLEGVCSGRGANCTNALPCFRGPSVNCSLDRSHLAAGDEQRTNKSHAPSAPASRNGSPADCCRQPSPRSKDEARARPCPIRLLIVRALFAPLRLSCAKCEYTFRTA